MICEDKRRFSIHFGHGDGIAKLGIDIRPTTES